MVAGIERLRKARQLLPVGAFSRRDMLAAASEYWAATSDSPGWPTELQSLSDELNRSLFLYGPIRDTIAHMTDRELRRLADKRLELVATAERLATGDPLA